MTLLFSQKKGIIMSVKYKHQDNICVEFYDSGCIVLDPKEEYYHLLNSTAAFIFENIPNYSVEDIARMIVEKYPNEVNYDAALNSILEMVLRMLEIDIITECIVE